MYFSNEYNEPAEKRTEFNVPRKRACACGVHRPRFLPEAGDLQYFLVNFRCFGLLISTKAQLFQHTQLCISYYSVSEAELSTSCQV